MPCFCRTPVKNAEWLISTSKSTSEQWLTVSLSTGLGLMNCGHFVGWTILLLEGLPTEKLTVGLPTGLSLMNCGHFVRWIISLSEGLPTEKFTVGLPTRLSLMNFDDGLMLSEWKAQCEAKVEQTTRETLTCFDGHLLKRALFVRSITAAILKFDNIVDAHNNIV